MINVTIYATGVCEESADNINLGGWCAILVSGNKEKVVSGGELFTEHSRMGLSAIISGLRVLNQSCAVHIVTDYKTLCDAFNDNWFDKWINFNWKGKDGNPIRNEDLWKQLAILRVIHDIDVCEMVSVENSEYLKKARKYAENIASGRGALAQSVSAAAS